MGIFKTVWRAITGPLGVLEDWAEEPLKRWENKREQENKDREVEREIRRSTGVETVKSENRMKEAKQQAELEIRMQTEIKRINAETEQWIKDQELERFKDLNDAIFDFNSKQSKLLIETANEIGKMNLALRAKALELISIKTNEFKELQKQALQEAAEEGKMVQTTFADNETMRGILYEGINIKLKTILESSKLFISSLHEDIQLMNKNIDTITLKGREAIEKRIDVFVPSANSPLLTNNQNRKNIDDVNAEDIS